MKPPRLFHRDIPGAMPTRTVAAALAVAAVGLIGLLIDTLADSSAARGMNPHLEATSQAAAESTPPAGKS
jgi:hypothetical protein